MNTNEDNYIYQIYSDESGNDSLRSICIVSGNSKALLELRKELTDIIKKNKLTELKFSEVRTHKAKIDSALEFIEKAVQFALSKIRIDVLTYNLKDSRHSIQGRDDIKNFEMMYYKLIRHCCERWNRYN